MKKNKTRYIFLMLVLGMFLSAATVMGASYFNKTEDFADEATDTNPSSTWYSYEDLLFEYANVTAANLFQVNDTTVADKSVAYFNLTADSYSYLEFDFRYDNSTHKEAIVYIMDSAGTGLTRFDIICYDGGDTISITYRNYSSIIWNNTATVNNTWYKLRWDFDYTNNQMTGSLFTSGGTSLNATTCPITDISGEYDYSNVKSFSIAGVVDEDIFMHFDNLKVYKAYNWGSVGQTTNYLTGTIVPLLFAVFLLIVIIGMALSGNASLEAMIALMLAAIIGMVSLAVVFGL